MDKILKNIPYLEVQDVNQDGTLKSHVGKGKPVVLMVQGNFCGYCTQAKPAFEEFARNVQNAVAVTVQIDGDQSEKQANALIAKINPGKGVPVFLGFDENGKFEKLHTGNRDANSLMQFASTL